MITKLKLWGGGLLALAAAVLYFFRRAYRYGAANTNFKRDKKDIDEAVDQGDAERLRKITLGLLK